MIGKKSIGDLLEKKNSSCGDTMHLCEFLLISLTFAAKVSNQTLTP
jgi:hypothetical protein